MPISDRNNLLENFYLKMYLLNSILKIDFLKISLKQKKFLLKFI